MATDERMVGATRQAASHWNTFPGESLQAIKSPAETSGFFLDVGIGPQRPPKLGRVTSAPGPLARWGGDGSILGELLPADRPPLSFAIFFSESKFFAVLLRAVTFLLSLNSLRQLLVS